MRLKPNKGYTYGKDLVEGKIYFGDVSVGEFWKEKGQVWKRTTMKQVFKVFPSDYSLFYEVQS